MSEYTILTRLLLAAALGSVLGLEREYRRKPAGLRTNVLIALGAALFTALSPVLSGYGASPDRVTAQIVTGVGFLGAGAILRSGRSIHGLTTAATIWVNAAIGVAAGSGQYEIAIGAAVIALGALIVLPFVERVFEAHAPMPRVRKGDDPEKTFLRES